MSNKNDKLDSEEPSWLSSDNDEKLRDEITPLFGTGSVSLADPATKAKEATSAARGVRDYGSASAVPPPTAPPPPPSAAAAPRAIHADDDEEKVILVETAPSTFVKTAMVDPETLKPHQPGQNACLWLFHLLEGISVTASLCLMVTQILPVVLHHASSSTKQAKPSASAVEIDILSMALRIYITVFCVLFICTETQAPIPVVRHSQLLQTYASRGFLYSFIGLICVEEAYSERVKGIVAHVDDSFHIGWASVFMEVSSWLMLSTGAVYVVLGLCCCKRLRDRMKGKERDAWKRYKEDMAAWKQRFG